MSQEIDTTTSRWWVGLDVRDTCIDLVVMSRLTGDARDHRGSTTLISNHREPAAVTEESLEPQHGSLLRNGSFKKARA